MKTDFLGAKKIRRIKSLRAVIRKQNKDLKNHQNYLSFICALRTLFINAWEHRSEWWQKSRAALRFLDLSGKLMRQKKIFSKPEEEELFPQKKKDPHNLTRTEKKKILRRFRKNKN